MFSVPFEVEKSIIVEKPPELLFEVIGDFSIWPKWSPWLCMEPDCTYATAGDAGKTGHRQEWSGKIIGAGNMTIVASRQDESLDYALEFLKPWKSRASVQFRLSAKGDRTEVTWRMQSALPVFLFFMKKNMEASLGGDFERGLAMLKELVETGAVASAVRVSGAEPRQEMYYVGKHRTCSMKEMESAMNRDLTEMSELRTSDRLPKPTGVVTLYHRFDPVKQVAEYTSGYVYAAPPKEVGEGTVTGRLPMHDALRVNHKGAHRHLGNAWAAAMGCARSGYKVNKSLPMYEVYTDAPQNVPEANMQTDIYLPHSDLIARKLLGYLRPCDCNASLQALNSEGRIR